MTPASGQPVLLYIADAAQRAALQAACAAAGLECALCGTSAEVESQLQRNPIALLVVGGQPLEFSAGLSQRYPFLTLALADEVQAPAALRAGAAAVLNADAPPAELARLAAMASRRTQYALQWIRRETRRAAEPLQQQMESLRAIQRLGQSITAKLELDQVLTAIVDAAVELTRAEEGSLLLLDHASGELYIRAAKNFDADFVETFRLPIHDALVSQVIHSGEPVMVDNSQPQKIKTAYLVHNLVYVPLKLHGTVIGILVVDNRTRQEAFQEGDMRLLSALAEYAVIALENARVFAEMTVERNERDTILRGISDGVVVVDDSQRLMLVNEVAREALGLRDQRLDHLPARDFIANPDLLALIDSGAGSDTTHIEIVDDQERVWNVTAANIPAVGLAITLHDVTQFKKMERIKSDFVSTVSHDLRSPLTAIMGYVELIERAGPVNDTQRDFIRRVLGSVQNITSLINNLVSLGQIEAGFEAHHEPVQLKGVVEFVLDGFEQAIEDKGLLVSSDLNDLPPVLANVVQMRQMVEHLLDNAIKYSHPGGRILIRGSAADDQLIFQVEDNGIGIPPLELLFVFDKFYRASNQSGNVSGTGLGLAIVKSIVEKHHGRTWVDSTLGQGSIFTVVLPTR